MASLVLSQRATAVDVSAYKFPMKFCYYLILKIF